MSPDTRFTAGSFRKPVVLLALLVAVAGVAGAVADIDTHDENGVIWLDRSPAVDDEITAVCQNEPGSDASVEIDGESLLADFEETDDGTWNATNSTEEVESLWDDDVPYGEVDVTLDCDNSSEEAVRTVTLADLSIDEVEDGSGFVGERLGETEFAAASSVSSLMVDTTVNGIALDRAPLDITFEEGSEYLDDSNMYDFGEWESGNGTISLRPNVERYFTNPIDMSVSYDGEKILTHEIDPHIYQWRLKTLKRPLPEIEFRNLGAEYEYEFTAENVSVSPPDTESLFDEDFLLTIEERDGDDWDTVEKEKEWLEHEFLDDDDNTHRITLGESEIQDLDAGTYRFTLLFAPHGQSDEHFELDSVRVVNTRTFEGRVQDSNGQGVETDFTLSREDGRSMIFSTDSNGAYEKEIGDADITSAELKFYQSDASREVPDATVVADSPTLTREAAFPDLDIDMPLTIGFHYWNSPPVDIPGLRPVNMMAINFGHDMDDASASMAVDTSSIDPRDLTVFECNEWNFMGQECLGEWNDMDTEYFSLDSTYRTLQIRNLELHETPENIGSSDDVLLNAYVAGVPSKLTLEGDRPLSVSGLESGNRVVAGSDLDVSGTVVTTQGDAVQDAEVTVELVGSDGVVEEFNTTSGPGGGFTVEAEAPSDTGSYTMHVTLRKSPYLRFDHESTQTFSVYYTTGLALDMPDLPTLVRGEETTFRVEVQNTGQTTVTGIDIDLSLNGISSQYIDVQAPDRLAGGTSADATLTVDLPADFCPAPCNNPPRITLNARGEADGETVEASGQMFTQVRDPDGTSTTQETSGEQNATGADETGAGPAFSPKSAVAATGEFIRRQSDVNLALGLILVFTVAVAVAVRKRNTAGGGRDMMQDRVRHGRISTPQVRPDDRSPPASPATSTATDAADTSRGTADGSADASGKTGDDDDEPEKYVCEDTGETFDTKEALELYREIHGLDED